MNKTTTTMSIVAAAMIAASIMVTAAAVTQQARAQAVPLIKVNTGDKQEDKLIAKFYKCLEKFSHPDPTGDQVKNCYVKVFGIWTGAGDDAK